jgi:gamma-glutamyltranspeptidase/glutathione hydrolase
VKTVGRHRQAPFAAALLALLAPFAAAAPPVAVQPVTAPHGMVVAGHPEAAALGAAVLAAGGEAMDAAVAVALALGVAEPYGSGLGGKLMLLYHEAATGRTFAVDGMDAAGHSLDAGAYRQLPAIHRTEGWSAVAVPGLPAALHLAHERWGTRPWAELVEPVAHLARAGATILPKTRDLIAERAGKLQQDAALAALFLPGGEPPPAGTRLPQPELAATLETLAAAGAGDFYRGAIAAAMVAAAQAGGGHLTADDLARYEARIVEPLRFSFAGHELHGGPPPTSGATLVAAILARLDAGSLAPPLRSAANLDRIGRAWREALPAVQASVGDAGVPAQVGTGPLDAAGTHDATTHFVIVDRHGNIVCATQSLSLHFGAGVAAAGIVMNNSMSNFGFLDPASPNFVAPGRRARSTIAPVVVLREGRPVLALGAPGAQRIPTAVLQVLLDHLALGRDLAEAIGDTRVHWWRPLSSEPADTIEAEDSLDPAAVAGLSALGWRVELREPPGRGLHFGGVNAVQLRADGARVGYADPRRTNAAAGN